MDAEQQQAASRASFTYHRCRRPSPRPRWSRRWIHRRRPTWRRRSVGASASSASHCRWGARRGRRATAAGAARAPLPRDGTKRQRKSQEPQPHEGGESNLSLVVVVSESTKPSTTRRRRSAWVARREESNGGQRRLAYDSWRRRYRQRRWLCGAGTAIIASARASRVLQLR